MGYLLKRPVERQTLSDESVKLLEIELAAARRTITAQSVHIQMLAEALGTDPERQPEGEPQLERYLLERLEAMEASTSWRVTRPLRSLKDHLRTVKRRSLNRIRRSGLALPKQSAPPLVTVIVPNFNHARYLYRRLDSIYSQTYRNFEVILLDDRSTDESTTILSEYARRHKAKTTLVLNDTNSGSPFHQWAKGISQARGSIVWIAESDDTCDKDFLSKLVPQFSDESVLLAYGDIQYIDEQDRLRSGLDSYRRGTGYDHWRTAYVRPSHQEFNGPFGIRNIIPNVSGALFRRPTLSADFVLNLSTFRTCGDWMFYLYVAAGGQIAYVPSARSYYRQHNNNTSVSATSTERFYQEHRLVAEELRSRYGVSDDILNRHYHSVLETYSHAFHTSPACFSIESAYDLDGVLRRDKTQLNVLVTSLGFTLGGGELLPIFLSNSLRHLGHNVTFVSLHNSEDDDPKIRSILDPSVAVLRPETCGASLTFLRTFGVDVVNTHNIAAEYFFAQYGIAEQQGRPKYVVTHHGSYDVSQSLPSHLHDFGRFVDHWVYLTERNLQRLRAAGVSVARQSKFPNGVPRVQLDSNRDELGIRPAALVCALVSRAIPEKGWKEAIDAVTRINADGGRPVDLLLVGSGPEYDRLLTEQSLPSFIKLLGLQANAARYYGLADIGLLPSYFPGESFPLTLAECLVAGKPCIATDRGEIRGMLTDDNGEIAGVVLNGQSKGGELSGQLEEAIRLLRDDQETYAASVAVAARRGKHLEMDAVAQKYADLFRSVLAEHKRTATQDV